MNELLSLNIAMTRTGKDGDLLDAQFQKLVESLIKDGWAVHMRDAVRYEDFLGRSYVCCYMLKDDEEDCVGKKRVYYHDSPTELKNRIAKLETKNKNLVKENKNLLRKCQKMKKQLRELRQRVFDLVQGKQDQQLTMGEPWRE